MKYDFTKIEAKWQQYWAANATFKTPNPGQPGFDAAKPKYYVLDMFPYPSGVGLHVGHPLGYIATDILARYKRMKGCNVLHPMGYDAFGLPAEQFAVEHGVHPRVTTQQNIANMTRQLKSLGLSYDWDRALATTEPEYYRWTQWIFLRLYNSWFDPSVNKARPIADLEQKLESGEMDIGLDGEPVQVALSGGMDTLGGPPVGARRWPELSPEEQAEVFDSKRLAFIDEVPVNWCPALGTVLANEEVTNEGRSERGNHPVFKRPLRQWMLRITAYAQRLADDLDLVDWPVSTKALQRNWIGRSEGARVDFPLAQGTAALPDDMEDVITVFTTRPDTLFGATYMVLAPEHPLVEAITTAVQRSAVSAYVAAAAAKTDVDRQKEATAGHKSGVFTGACAINPVNDERIPIWIADYVMMGYGTGAIMAVPGHDERDFDFAEQFGLPIVQVVGVAPLENSRSAPAPLSEAFVGDGWGMNSANDEVSLNALPTPEAKKRIVAWLEEKGIGEGAVQYKLRDWLFSRQRYWGEPFPILHGPNGQTVGVDDSQLPVLLPELDNFQPAVSDDPNAPPLPPLARAPDAWKYVDADGTRFTRECNTMPQWAGSCWYYLRFLDPRNTQRFVGKEAERYWMGGRSDRATERRSDEGRRGSDPRSATPTSRPGDQFAAGVAGHARPGGVDLYVGGVEHAVLHLLYARFWHKVLFDLGYVSTPEPFGKLFNQGYIQAFYYEDDRGVRVEAEEVVTTDGKPAAEVQDRDDCKFLHKGKPVKRLYGKMGKSLKNAIAPDDVCRDYGCDTLRLYEMYLGPLDQSKVWRTRDISGVHRFLQRLWRAFVDETTDALRVSEEKAPEDLRRLLHKTIKRVTEAMESMSFNVAIAALIELNNEVVKRYPAEEATERRSDEATKGSAGNRERGTGNSPELQPRAYSLEPRASVPREIAEVMVLCLSPMAPHIAEELWSRLGHKTSLAYAPFPAYDPALLVEDQVEYPVQVNGKLRGRVTVPLGSDEKTVEAAARADTAVAKLIEGKTVRKVIVIKDRLINIVVV